MSVNQMSVNQMSVNQMSVNQMSVNQIYANQIYANQMSINQMSINQMSVNQMWVDQMFVHQMSVGQTPYSQNTSNRLMQVFEQIKDWNDILEMVYNAEMTKCQNAGIPKNLNTLQPLYFIAKHSQKAVTPNVLTPKCWKAKMFNHIVKKHLVSHFDNAYIANLLINNNAAG